MPKTKVMASNPSVTDASQPALSSSPSTKIDSITPLETPKESTVVEIVQKQPTVAEVKEPAKQPAQNTSTSNRKGSNFGASTVVPADYDSDQNNQKLKRELSRGDSIKTRPRTSSVTSDSGQKGDKSILKKSRYAANNAKTTGRKDSYGVTIKKGGKRHKITFKEQLLEVKVVESWKDYNNREFSTQSCVCNVF